MKSIITKCKKKSTLNKLQFLDIFISCCRNRDNIYSYLETVFYVFFDRDFRIVNVEMIDIIINNFLNLIESSNKFFIAFAIFLKEILYEQKISILKYYQKILRFLVQLYNDSTTLDPGYYFLLF